MTNISRKKLASKDYLLAYQELSQLIARLKNTDAHYLMDELLTESERIMLVKRFAAILMLDRNLTPYRVSSTLDISISTALRINKQYIEGTFDNLLTSIPLKQKSLFLEVMKTIILAQVDGRARARLMRGGL